MHVYVAFKNAILTSINFNLRYDFRIHSHGFKLWLSAILMNNP